MKRIDFLKILSLSSLSGALKISDLTLKHKTSRSLSICTLVPAETLGPFPSLPSGDAMYWRNNMTDSQAGVSLTFTIKLFGTNNCGVLSGYRVDVWHCNADGFYSHYATGGQNNGHSGNNTPVNNANLIYNRATQITNSNGEVTFTTIFPGWYPGRTCHIHYAVYSGGTINSPNGWIQQRVSQFTFPITEKNNLYTSYPPYTTYGPDPLHPDNDNVFSSPAGQWQTLQMATLVGSGSYSSYYEAAITATGVLPLDLIGFNGSVQNDNGILWWKTENEINFSHFELESGDDGEDFVFVARIDGTGNNNKSTQNYIYEDTGRILFGNVYYRLKIIDFDGNYKYSSVVGLKYDTGLSLRLYPLPANELIVLQHPFSKGNERILIIDEYGKPVGIGNISPSAEFTQIDLTLCRPGIHYLVYSSGFRAQALKFLIQR